MLTFSWPTHRASFGTLFGFLGVSAGLHALLFLVLQVDPSEKVTAPEREQEIQILRPDLPDHQALLTAVEAASPLPSLSYRLLSVDDLIRQPYASVLETAFETPLEPGRWRPVPAKAVPVLANPDPHSPPTRVASPPSAGRILLTQSLQERVIHLPKAPMAPSIQAVDAPIFLLGVLPDGNPGHVILQKSSGSEAADRVAEVTLRQITFTPAEAGPHWGEVILEWSALPH